MRYNSRLRTPALNSALELVFYRLTIAFTLIFLIRFRKAIQMERPTGKLPDGRDKISSCTVFRFDVGRRKLLHTLLGGEPE